MSPRDDVILILLRRACMQFLGGVSIRENLATLRGVFIAANNTGLHRPV